MKAIAVRTMMFDYSREETSGSGFRLYFDTQDRDYISATTLLGLYEPTESLDKWRERVGEEQANRITQEAITRGKRAHSNLEAYFNGIAYDEDDLYASNAICNFYKYVNFIDAEKPVFFRKGKVRYAGRFDQLIYINKETFKDKKGNYVPTGYALCDLKTKDKLPRHDIADFLIKNCMQLAAYYKAINVKEADIKINSAFLVYTTQKSTKVLYLDQEKLDFYWKCFKILLLDYYYIKPLKYSWSELVAKSNLTYDMNTLSYKSMVPVPICSQYSTIKSP